MVDVGTFIDYVKCGDTGRMEYALLESRYDIDTKDQSGCTALHHAASLALCDNQLDMVRFLIDRGADVNIKDESQSRETVLHRALQAADCSLTSLIIESPNFNIVRCDALQRSRMLPSCCVIDDVHRHVIAASQYDSDCTLAKRRSFGDQFLMFVRQNTRDQLSVGGGVTPSTGLVGEVCGGREVVRDVMIIQDAHLPPLSHLLDRFDPQALTSLYLVDCRLNVERCDAAFDRLSLKTLVLSNTRLQRLPTSLLRMTRSLQVLKIDRNRLTELPDEIGNLVNLRTLSFDAQRPRLRTVPASIVRLHRLQILTFSDNRLDSISFAVTLSNIRDLRCSQNRILSLPEDLVTLRDLNVLDVSHNRIERIPHSFLDLISRLYRFDYFNLTLRPSYIRRDQTRLLSHLQLERFLAAFAVSGQRSVEDVTVGVVGETHSGKSTLVSALKDDKGVSARQEAMRRESSNFHTDHFEASVDEETDKHEIYTVTMANNVLDGYSRHVRLDLYLLLIDLTSLELHNGSQHLIARHVTRLQTWLQTLYELSPETPVLLVGTHAEQVRAVSFQDIWRMIQDVLDQGRAHHSRRYADSTCPHCLLCCPRPLATRQTLLKSRTGHAGFVDVTYQQQVSDSEVLIPNGFIPNGNRNGALIGGLGSVGGVMTSSPASSSFSSGNPCRFPHIVGYYEVDSKKIYPKDMKKSNLSVEQLRSAVVRLTRHAASLNRVPPSWASFNRHLATIRSKAPQLICLPYDEVVSICRSFDIPHAHVPLMLRYFHFRGRLVYFDNEETLSRLVIINPSWFVHKIHLTYDSLDRSRCAALQLVHALTDKEFDRQLMKKDSSTLTSLSAGHSLPYSSRWLLTSFQHLDVCLPIGETLTDSSVSHESSIGSSSSGGVGGMLVFPSLLESGSPRPDVWPDAPEWDEKQITCDFAVRTLKPGMFSNLIQSLNDEGRRLLEIVSNPLPVFLSHHAVFFIGVDSGGCEDCYAQRQRQLFPVCGGSSHVMSDGAEDDLCDAHDDVLHKVHIQLHANLVGVRVHVRGVSPCCAMKAVLGFIELYLDDIPDDWSESVSSSSDKSSWNASLELRRSSSLVSNSLHTLGGASEAHVASNGGVGQSSLGVIDHVMYGGEVRGHHTHGVSGGGVFTDRSGGGESHVESDDDGDERQMFLLCPKCILLRHSKPERIVYQSTPIRRKAICNKWHNLGSWTRVVTGNYHFSNVDLLFGGGGSLQTSLPDYEHPRLALLLPPSLGVCQREWYVCSRMRFLEGFEVHFLCENPAFWHLTPNSGYRLNRSARYLIGRPVHSHLQSILSLALSMIQIVKKAYQHRNRLAQVETTPDLASHRYSFIYRVLAMIQIVQGVAEHPQNARMFSAAVSELVQMYDYLRNADSSSSSSSSSSSNSSNSSGIGSLAASQTSKAQQDSYSWLTKNKDRLVAMLTKALASASDGVPDLYFKAGSSMRAETIFQCHSTASREQLSRFLRIDSTSTRFGDLRPIYVGREIRWVCDAHYEELRSMPS